MGKEWYCSEWWDGSKVKDRNEKDNESLVDTKLSRFEVYDEILPKRNDGINAEIDELEAQIHHLRVVEHRA